MSTPDSQSSRLPQLPQHPWLPVPSAADPALGHSHGEPDPWVINPRRLFAAVVRFKWVVILVVLLGTAGGVGVSRLLLKPTYATHATLWVDVPDIHTRDQGPIQTAQLVGSSGWVDLLKSYAVLEPVVRQRRLYLGLDTPGDSAALASFAIKDRVEPGTYRVAVASGGGRFQLTSKTRGAALVQQGAVGDSIGPALGFAWLPPSGALTPGRTIDFSSTTPAAAAQALADQLRVQTDMLEGKVGNFMSVELRGSNPDAITAIVNAMAERFVVVAAELRREKLSELVKILGEQVRNAQLKLTQAEQTLRDFRVRSATLLSGAAAPLRVPAPQGRDPAAETFFDLKVSREELRLDRTALEGLLAAAADSGLSTDALETIASVQRSSALTQALRELSEKQATLRALRYRYTTGLPLVKRAMADISTLQRQTIPTMTRALIAQLAVREAALARRVDSAAGGLRRIPPLAIDDARLDRDVTIAAELFTNIQQRYAEAQLAEVSSIPEVRILDRAERPETPLFDIGAVLIALAFL